MDLATTFGGDAIFIFGGGGGLFFFPTTLFPLAFALEAFGFDDDDPENNDRKRLNDSLAFAFAWGCDGSEEE